MRVVSKRWLEFSKEQREAILVLLVEKNKK